MSEAPEIRLYVQAGLEFGEDVSIEERELFRLRVAEAVDVLWDAIGQPKWAILSLPEIRRMFTDEEVEKQQWVACHPYEGVMRTTDKKFQLAISVPKPRLGIEINSSPIV